MRHATKVVFRRITGSDFFNIYKASGTEKRGGGQSYIDFSTSGISLANWRSFFAGVPTVQKRGGPLWEFDVQSLSLGLTQRIQVGQRRKTSVSLRSQKINSSRGNRVYAWHPNYTGFPAPSTAPTKASDPRIQPLITDLVVYLIRDDQGDYWAGWFKSAQPLPGWSVDPRLARMLTDTEGYIDLTPRVPFDEGRLPWPFDPVATAAATVAAPPPSPALPSSPSVQPAKGRRRRDVPETELLEALFENDVARTTTRTKVVRNVIKRNKVAAQKLKLLYGKCQISGTDYVFDRTSGGPYLEAHHLVPLGEGGSDTAHNLIVVSAHIHRMLHYAKVAGIDLARIHGNTLEITLNDVNYTITWHPEHAKRVLQGVSP